MLFFEFQSTRSINQWVIVFCYWILLSPPKLAIRFSNDLKILELCFSLSVVMASIPIPWNLLNVVAASIRIPYSVKFVECCYGKHPYSVKFALAIQIVKLRSALTATNCYIKNTCGMLHVWNILWCTSHLFPIHSFFYVLDCITLITIAHIECSVHLYIQLFICFCSLI